MAAFFVAATARARRKSVAPDLGEKGREVRVERAYLADVLAKIVSGSCIASGCYAAGAAAVSSSLALSTAPSSSAGTGGS
jgi:hypothetical protein